MNRVAIEARQELSAPEVGVQTSVCRIVRPNKGNRESSCACVDSDELKKKCAGAFSPPSLLRCGQTDCKKQQMVLQSNVKAMTPYCGMGLPCGGRYCQIMDVGTPIITPMSAAGSGKPQ
jgi:hypothetical protein